VLLEVSLRILRVISMPEDTELTDLHELFQAILGWSLNLGSSLASTIRERGSRTLRA